MRYRRCRKWCCVCSRRLRWCWRSTYNQCIRARVRVQWSHCVGTAIKVWRWLCVSALNWITRQAGQARSHLHLLGQLHIQVHLHVSRPLVIFGYNRKLWAIFGRKRKKTENLIYVYGRNRKCTESPFLVIFGAENVNENEFRSVSTSRACGDQG